MVDERLRRVHAWSEEQMGVTRILISREVPSKESQVKPTCVISSGYFLYFDDICPEVCQKHGTGRTGQHPRQIEDPCPAQRGRDARKAPCKHETMLSEKSVV